MEGPRPDKFAFGVRIGRVVDACRPVKGYIRKWFYPILPCGGHQDVGLLCQLMVKACADADDLIGHKADLDISAISMQQESAVLALHAGKTGTDLHSFYSSQVFDKKCPISPQMQDIFREMGATYSLLYPEQSGIRTPSSTSVLVARGGLPSDPLSGPDPYPPRSWRKSFTPAGSTFPARSRSAPWRVSTTT